MPTHQTALNGPASWPLLTSDDLVHGSIALLDFKFWPGLELEGEDQLRGQMIYFFNCSFHSVTIIFICVTLFTIQSISICIILTDNGQQS